MGPPVKGDPVSPEQAHIPLKPPPLIYALNQCGQLPSWDTRKQHVAMYFTLLPNVAPTLSFILESVQNLHGRRVWHLLTDEITSKRGC